MSFYDDNDEYYQNIIAISDNKQKVTYKDLANFSNIIGDIIENRSLVFTFCSNTIGSLFGYVSFLRNNIVPLLLNENIDIELVENLIKVYLPQYIYIPKHIREKYMGYRIIIEQYGYVLLKTNFEKKYLLNDDLALLLTTSGSTGSPKFVRQSNINIQSNAKSIVKYLELDNTERPITTLPMSYTYGLSIINSHLSVGATILLTDYTFMQKEFWNFLKEEKATSFGGVPYSYEILHKLRFFRMDLPYLKTMTQAGGKLSPELHQQFAEYAQINSMRFVVMYGQTEATARMSYLPYEKSLEKCGSMGIAIPGGEFSLIDINENTITESNVVGELIYKGSNVALGYAECGDDLIKGDERNGVLVTGDMAKRDIDDFYYIVGRKKRFLKIFGNRINLDETEGMLKSKFDGIECACTGVDDHMYIFIVSEDKEESLMKEVKVFISSKTKLNQTAFTIKTIDTLKKNDSSKTDYIALEKYYN